MSKKRRLLLIFGGIALIAFTIYRSTKERFPTTAQRTANISHSTATPLEKTVTRSRMIEPDPTETRLSAKDNAATDYRKAFALIEKLTPRELAIMNSKTPQPSASDTENTALLEKISPLLAALEAGANKSGCDWGIRHLDGGKLISFLTPARTLFQIALWDAAQHISEEPEKAVRDLYAVHQLANNLDLGFTSGLMNGAIQERIAEFVGEHAEQLTPDFRAFLVIYLDNAQLSDSFERSLKSESDLGQTWIQTLRSGYHSDGTPLTDAERAAWLPTQYGKDFVEVLDKNQRVASELNQSLFWSDKKFGDWLRQHQATLNITVYSKVRDDMRAEIVRHMMVSAGLTVLNDGAAALTRYPDPFSAEKFQYRLANDGNSFELQSTVLQKGKPVSLTFRLPPR